MQTSNCNRFTIIKLRCPRKTNIPLRQTVLSPLEYYINAGNILHSTGRAGGSQERSFAFSRNKFRSSTYIIKSDPSKFNCCYPPEPKSCPADTLRQQSAPHHSYVALKTCKQDAHTALPSFPGTSAALPNTGSFRKLVRAQPRQGKPHS